MFELGVAGRAAINEIIDGKYYLLAIFDEIMNICAEANGCRMWMCKSMGTSQYYDMLLTFYGKERLRFIYLVRDPRDVTLSFMNTPVGDCHPYTIATKWAKLQNHALRILSENPDLVHQVRYEHVLQDKVGEVANINSFMGSRGVSKTLRRGSVVVLADDEKLSGRAKDGREANKAKELSYQFQNLGRGQSFAKLQFAKYLVEMEDDDIQMVESAALEEMTRLGYEPHLVGKTKEPISFTAEKIEEYEKLNKDLVDTMNSDLAQENPGDLNRRLVQASVLRKSRVHFRQSFANLEFDREEFLEDVDDEDDTENPKFDISEVNFAQWPLKASTVGFLSRESVTGRLTFEETKSMELGADLILTYASASQRGYYPSDRGKANQDAFISGLRADSPDLTKSYALFSVFDGHGDLGDQCAIHTRDVVEKSFMNAMQNSNEENQEEFIQTTLRDSYLQANNELEENKKGESAGTTAVSLCITNDFKMYISNVGDSRCIIVAKNHNFEVKVMTQDHTPDREDEKERIVSCGGLVMTSDQYDVMDPKMISSEPKRVWSKKGKWPGTAFTRSIGDTNAKDLGVIAEPEFSKADAKNNEVFVIGSDGIFDFISDKEIADIVSSIEDPMDCCKALVGMAYYMWSENEERTDDITVIVGEINKQGLA